MHLQTTPDADDLAQVKAWFQRLAECVQAVDYEANFRWRLDGVQAMVAGDRLSAVGLAIFDSDGFDPQGTKFDRRGRATVAFRRTKIGDAWIAIHTHMSLFRGTPDRSHGKFGPQ
jgi:ketosteroid isomerase-like protein